MNDIMLNEAQIKELVRQALVELLQERKDVLYDLVVEVMEDIALVRAIREGEETERVPRADVFRVLEETP